MDEIEYAIQGYVDRLRIERDFTYGIMMSSGNMGKSPPAKTDLFPFPYDHELNGKMSADDIIATYKQYYPEYNGN